MTIERKAVERGGGVQQPDMLGLTHRPYDQRAWHGVNVSRTKTVLAFGVIYLVWGSTYLAIRFALESLPPVFTAGMRYFIGGSLLTAWMYAREARRPRLSSWLPTAAVGIPLVAVTYGFLLTAQQTVPSGLAALLFAMTPVWIVLLDWARPNGVRPRWPVMVGIGLGIVGVGLLVNPGGLPGGGGVSIRGAAMLMVSTISWSLGSILSRHIPQPASKALSTGIMMISGGTVLLLVSSLKGEIAAIAPASISLKSGLALAYLIATGIMGLSAYIWLLSVTSPARVATYAFVNPVIAILLGVMLAGEMLSLRTVLCSIMIVAAVMTIVLVRARNEKDTGAGCGSKHNPAERLGKDGRRESVRL